MRSKLLVLMLALVLCGCSSAGGGGGGNLSGWATKLVPAQKGPKLSPEPPEDFYWIRVHSAKIPPRTKGGKLWDDVGGWPDPLVVVFINDKEVMRSKTITDELQPVWDEGGGNFVLGASSMLRVDLLDGDAIKDLPIGTARQGGLSAEDLKNGYVQFDVVRHGHVKIEVDRAHALIGLGFDYGVFKTGVLVQQVLKHSPASRGGMKVGDLIVAISGKKTKGMKAAAVRSELNSVPAKGIQLTVKHEGGTTETMLLQQGPIYPTFKEYGLLP